MPGAKPVTTAPQPADRMPVIDAVKVLASQTIVWHHLALYGPIGRSAHAAAEDAFGWIADDGRAAVYAFLVIAGYLAAGSLLPLPGRPAPIGGLAAYLRLALARYRRLAPPYVVAVVAAVVVAAVARLAMNDADTPAPPTVGQLVAHAMMLQDVLGYPALSAGVWYVAIDLQLFLLLAAIAWLAQAVGRRHSARDHRGRPDREGRATPDPGDGTDPLVAAVTIAAVIAGVLASWTFCSRFQAFDAYAAYFFGAYGLGVIARWSREVPLPYPGDRRGRERLHPARCEWMAVVMAIAGIALLSGPDRRELVAVGVALLLILAPRARAEARGGESTVAASRAASLLVAATIAALARRSYSLFLIHYPVCLLANALFALATGGAWAPPGSAGVVAAVAAWLACNLASGVLYRWVESVEGRRRLLARLRGDAPPPEPLASK